MNYNIEEIIKMFENANISKLELEIGDMKIKLEKNNKNTNVINNDEVVATSLEELVEVEGYKVLTPVVGTFYVAKAVNKPPFVKIGDKVKKGDVLCIIEAMKVMNEVTAPVAGTIIDILPTNESLVEYDQVLFVIKE